MQGASAQAPAAVAPGEGVLPPGADASPGPALKMTGARLRRIDAAALIALGIERVMIREPRVRVVRVGAGPVIAAAAALIASAVEAEGGIAIAMQSPEPNALEAALHHEGADAVIAIGGTGSGRNDESVRILARNGTVAFHGIGIAPGETTAFGYVGARPVLLLPGRLDAALAGWLTVGRRMLARLAFRLSEEQPFNAELSRKIASPLGLPKSCRCAAAASRAEPLASHYLSMQTLMRADGWILVPADSEGYPGRDQRSGETVAMSNKPQAQHDALLAPSARPRGRSSSSRSSRRRRRASASSAGSISRRSPASASRSPHRSAACWRTT